MLDESCAHSPAVPAHQFGSFITLPHAEVKNGDFCGVDDLVPSDQRPDGQIGLFPGAEGRTRPQQRIEGSQSLEHVPTSAHVRAKSPGDMRRGKVMVIGALVRLEVSSEALALQLFWDGNRWWISGVAWDDERPDNPIPAEFLPS